MKLFIAKIGPPRLVLGILAFAYAVVSAGFEILLEGKLEWTQLINELLALVFAILNIGQELIKGYLRNRFTMVEMDAEGIFDRRIMKEKLLWMDIAWIDPHPGGLPDRLRINGKVNLTTFGKLRNLLVRLIRQLPRDEIIVTFGGLNKAGAQAATWIADNKPGFVPDVWKSADRPQTAEIATQHSALLLSAGAFWREWVGAVVSGIVVVALIGAISPAIVGAFPNLDKPLGLSAVILIVGALVATMVMWTGAVGAVFWQYKRQGDRLIVISHAGFSDERISSQFVSWSEVESITFEYRDMGRLINEQVPILVQLKEGTRLTKPTSRFFWPSAFFRSVATPELVALKHRGTTTSASEIIEMIQRHAIPVALREIARG